nr:MAG TPA: hypothetical protein [Caudoviricetes sp.]
MASLWRLSREEALQQALARTVLGCNAVGTVGAHPAEKDSESQERGERR